MKDHAINIRDLFVGNGDLQAVRGVSFSIPVGGRMGLVGESGSGKTLTALAMMGLLPVGWSTEGHIQHDGVDLTCQSDTQLSRRRGRTISMVFQDPLTALDPVRRVGHQITSVIRRHSGAGKAEATEQAEALFRQMNLPRPVQMLRAYPHQLSGGQRQRVMIAIALACYPQLIIADEPTTALDVTIQAQIIETVRELREKLGTAVIWITHDLGVVAGLADRVVVMYGGEIVEQALVGPLYAQPAHPYTQGLLESVPRLDQKGQELASIPGQPPSLLAEPVGCSFRPRCPYAFDRCQTENPVLMPIGGPSDEHLVKCWWDVAGGKERYER